MVRPISLGIGHCIPNFIPLWVLLLTSASNAPFVELWSPNYALSEAQFAACHIPFNPTFHISLSLHEHFLLRVMKGLLTWHGDAGRWDVSCWYDIDREALTLLCHHLKLLHHAVAHKNSTVWASQTYYAANIARRFNNVSAVCPYLYV